jgi:hypothetical protein
MTAIYFGHTEVEFWTARNTPVDVTEAGASVEAGE